MSDDADWGDFLDHAISEMYPMVERSAVSLILVPDGEPTPEHAKLWVELGASVMLDKPLMVIASAGQQLPAKLVGIADQIVRVESWDDPEHVEAVFRPALTRLARRIG